MGKKDAQARKDAERDMKREGFTSGDEGHSDIETTWSKDSTTKRCGVCGQCVYCRPYK